MDGYFDFCMVNFQKTAISAVIFAVCMSKYAWSNPSH